MKRGILYLMLAVCLFLAHNAKAQEYRRLTNLPAIYINTFNNQGITSKDYYIYCTLFYVDEEDNVLQFDSVEIRGRGNSTWNLAKKPYKIKFHEKEKFLGKGYAKAKKWTLLANAADKSLIRNAITSEMGNFIGMKNPPAAKFVDLTLNGVYQGNYQISDQVEVKAHRVNIIEQDFPLTETSDITGGYLLEVDGFKDGNYFTSSHNLPIRIHYPEEDEIVADQKNYIRNYVNRFESALFSDNFKDPELGYRPYVDSLSMANLYVATEISGNIDGFWSMYFYKDQNDPKLYFGPLWDYDIAYDNDSRISQTERRLMVDEGYGEARTWFKQMWNDEWFAKLINKRFEDVTTDGLEDFLYQKIDSLNELLQESQELNYQKWGINRRVYHEITLYSTYEQYITELKTYINQHIAYLKTTFASRKPAEPTPPFEPQDYYYNIINVNTGNAIDLLRDNNIPYSQEDMPEPGTEVCSWNLDKERESQYWEFTKVGDYFFITNQLGLALNDPTEGVSTATTNTGTQLNVAEPDSTDLRQLWTITPQNTNGQYNLTNAFTQHTANLNGGNSVNRTAILSYTTNDRNSISKNRLWYITRTAVQLPEKPEDPTGIEMVNHNITSDYALVYSPVTQQIRFAGENPADLNFNVSIYNMAGQKIDMFNASQPFSVAQLPTGVYIVSWMTNGKIRSTKFKR